MSGGWGELKLEWALLSLPFRDPFRIARRSHGEGNFGVTLLVRLTSSEHPGLEGLGEGFPDPFYGETPETMLTVLRLLLPLVKHTEPTAEGLRLAEEAGDSALHGHGAAKCALDVAMADLAAKIARTRLVDLLGLPDMRPPTDFTIGLDEPQIVAERARRAASFPFLKIKVGGTSDLEALKAVRAVYSGPIRVDANTAWSRPEAERLLEELIELGVELIEQPFGAKKLGDMAWLQERSPIPIIADESAVTIDDLDSLVNVCQGVNVKLAKCGGVGRAQQMLQRALDFGFRTFVGSMEETSIVIAASAVVACLAEWVDLDGNLLLADDPVTGLDLGSDKRWRLPTGPGLGVELRRAIAWQALV